MKSPTDVVKRPPSSANKSSISPVKTPPARAAAAPPKFHFEGLQNHDSDVIARAALDSRVLIIEGIPGSGKDTFQAYLKELLKGREVHDYSEGELLHSWKHVPIDGIFKLRVNFMKLFVNSIRNIVNRDKNTVFLLNRFHLSTYITTIVRQPDLRRDYDKVVEVLRTLPVHVFLLQLDRNELEARSSHAERSSTWRNYQQQRAKNDGFSDTVQRYVWQQTLMLDIAKQQQLPFSVLRCSAAPQMAIGRAQTSSVSKIISELAQPAAAEAIIPLDKNSSMSKLSGKRLTRQRAS